MTNTWARTSRPVIRDSHLKAGCPICLQQVELDHQEALETQALLLALQFAELGLVACIQCEPERTLPLGWHTTDFNLVA